MSVSLFYEILAKSKNSLPLEVQEIIVRWSLKAPSKEKSSVLAHLAARSDLSESSVEIISKNKSAKVVSAMLLNPSIQKEVTKKMLEKETRVSVLRAVASVTSDQHTLENLLEKNNSKILEGIASNTEASKDTQALALIKLVNLARIKAWSANYQLQSFLSDNPEYLNMAVENLNKDSLAIVLEYDLRNLSQSSLARVIKVLVTDKLQYIKNASENDTGYFSRQGIRSLHPIGVSELSQVLRNINLITSHSDVAPQDFFESGKLWESIRNTTSVNFEKELGGGETLTQPIAWLEAGYGNQNSLNIVNLLVDAKSKRLEDALSSDNADTLTSIVSLVYSGSPSSALLVENLVKNKSLKLEYLPVYKNSKHSSRLLRELLARSCELSSIGENHIENYIKITGDISITRNVKSRDKRIELISRGVADFPAWRLSALISKGKYVQEITEALTIEKIYQLVNLTENSDLESYILNNFIEFLEKYPGRCNEFENMAQDYHGSLKSLFAASGML